MKLETRVRVLEKHLAHDTRGETWQERLDRFNALYAQGIAFEDIQAIAAGQWDAVTAPVLLASKHRDRWELAAPVLIHATRAEYERPKIQDEHIENAACKNRNDAARGIGA